MSEPESDEAQSPVVCKNCFKDPGLRLMFPEDRAAEGICPNCGKYTKNLLGEDGLKRLAYQFFVRGSHVYTDYGGAPRIQFNAHQRGSVTFRGGLQEDAQLIEHILHIGFFEYGPRLWMIGEIEPLKELQDKKTRRKQVKRIIEEFPEAIITDREQFFRVRKSPRQPGSSFEYDAPPAALRGKGRLESRNTSVFYASQDLEICVHEARFAAGDELYCATLQPSRDLRMLDLAAILNEDVSEFESLDLAVNMVFLAGSHSYAISRAIAREARQAGFDGIIYPSFYSLLRTGGSPVETAFGLSLRRFGDKEYERAKIIRNFALFDYPVRDGLVKVIGINRLEITTARYGIVIGPV
ncbi:RES family NAD+ phosphorylase [Novosphingopyxis sp. YJ-S2-01]|uniref:RES family NAD+ phosphorylase n=1 Tax=Novosphingopyxis sp. YJ-S2-01 TaxID=2794021 RepID=UPI0018DCDDCA|nr:RES family NAD+ phosphorylase [Novosphingopyxis sp. YJ-S2-01]MBH9536970.1 RES family NAD+ phosphorylase [Novosphingopyxis sp. YJ-S2-01]